MASSTVGASTFIVWNRRSSAASFSMYLRYSFIVVAPTHCNSPRLSAGLMMFDASMAPSAEPAPTIVCSSSMKRIAFFELAPVFCSRYHQRQIERDHAFVAQQFGHVATCNLLRQSLGNGRFANACFTDQDRIVLRPSTKDLNDALYFIAPPNHRIKFALSRQIGQITAKRAERRSLDVSFRRFAAFLVRFGRGEIWIELFKNLVARAFDIDFKTLEHS